MHRYEISDENFTDLFKREWFSPKEIENFYDKKQKSILFEIEKKYFEVFDLFADTSFSVCELEKYREYYGINRMKEEYPEEYPNKLLEIYETLEENTEYPLDGAEDIFKLVFRRHIWCIFKFANGTRIFFEKPGILTVLTAENHADTVKNIKNFEIIHKDF